MLRVHENDLVPLLGAVLADPVTVQDFKVRVFL